MPTHTTLPPFSLAGPEIHCFSRYCCGFATTTQIVTLLVPLLCEDINCVGRRKTYPCFLHFLWDIRSHILVMKKRLSLLRVRKMRAWLILRACSLSLFSEEGYLHYVVVIDYAMNECHPSIICLVVVLAVPRVTYMFLALNILRFARMVYNWKEKKKRTWTQYRFPKRHHNAFLVSLPRSMNDLLMPCFPCTISPCRLSVNVTPDSVSPLLFSSASVCALLIIGVTATTSTSREPVLDPPDEETEEGQKDEEDDDDDGDDDVALHGCGFLVWLCSGPPLRELLSLSSMVWCWLSVSRAEVAERRMSSTGCSKPEELPVGSWVYVPRAVILGLSWSSRWLACGCLGMFAQVDSNTAPDSKTARGRMISWCTLGSVFST